VIVSRRPVSYGPINPEECHKIFIQSALVEGQVKEPLPFLMHNLRLVEKIGNLEDKVRQRDILASEQAVADFYSQKLPGVYDIRSLKKRIKERGDDGFLKMREENLLLSQPDDSVLAGYPDKLAIGDRAFRLSYKFAPGSEADGMTVTIPSTLASGFPAEKLDWMVPGLLKEKITALIKALPKRIRKQLIPVSRTAEIISGEMKKSNEPLITALSRFIYRRFGVDIPASEWSADEIPDHLRMRVSITDHQGREIHAGKDFYRIKEGVEPASSGEKELKVWKTAREKWEKSGITSWDFGDLPEQISLGASLAAYPGLVPEKNCVNILLFASSEQALENHKKGLEALFCFHLKKDLKFLNRILVLPDELTPAATYFGGPRVFQKALYDNLIHRLFHINIRSREAFNAHAQAVRPTLVSNAKALLEKVGEVLRAFHQIRSVLHTIETANNANHEVQELCAGIRADLVCLIPKDFLEQYSLDRFDHLPRYLKAMEVRVERGAYNVEKDKRKAAAAEVFVKALQKMTEALSPYTSQEKRAALEACRWMVEEFKVSLFAPELKTAFPVSKKRLQAKVREIERMA
jgi:ATP-dependent helicase HrpA